MPTFEVHVTGELYEIYSVEAENIGEARVKWKDGVLLDSDVGFLEVEKIEMRVHA